MDACCNCCRSAGKEMVDSEVKEDTAEEQKEVEEKGFVVKRRCTDVLCLGIWIGHLVLFFIISFIGAKDGNPQKLYLPRDYRGSFCSMNSNWNWGGDFKDFPKQSYMMNVSAMTDVVAKQFMCSTAAKTFLLSANGFNTTADSLEYQSECCLIPSSQCTGSLALGGDITGTLGGANTALVTKITGRMGELTNTASAYNLWSTIGANEGVFNNIWSQASEYLVKTCVAGCSPNLASVSSTSTVARSYRYEPPVDSKLAKAWKLLYAAYPNEAFMTAFVYKALPLAECPYDPEYCVPMPGVEFAEISNGYCTFKMGADVINAVGSTMASTFETLGGDAIASSVTETFGGWWGDFERSIDTFVIVCVCCFIVGLLFLVILRFTVKFCVWFAIFIIFVALVLGGGFAWVRAHQCKNSGLFDTAKQTGTAVVVAGTTAVTNAVTGKSVSEAFTGDGADYRGLQTRTRSNNLCQAWAATSPHDQAGIYTAANFPNSDLLGNYCRNPYNAGDAYKASGIWCFTTSTDKVWERCDPIGVIQPQCEHGYAVSGEAMRKALEISSFVIWALALIWCLLVFCFLSRIRLAIALNAVAAKFVANTPTVLIVPVVQAIVGCLWIAGWVALASFLLSQVPSDYVPTGAYATYAEAYGTNTTAGACTGSWPTGFVYKAPNAECDVSDALVPKCWKCGPPRYVINWKAPVAFFTLLWNNAFLIALGQCMIAGAVGVWFFTPNEEKGKMRKGQALRQSNWNVWRYHAGSLAFGSFILALVQFIRYMMKYFEKQAEAQKNYVLALILRVVQCCILCFERLIKFLNKNAYIQIAIRGTPFCTSAMKAFKIITANILRFGTVAILGYVIACIGYVFIMAATLVIGYFLMKWMHDDISPAIPMVVYGIVSYLVGKLFMNVFGLAVDTCLQCVIFAEEKCPTGNFIPPALKNVIDKSKAGKDSDE